MKYFIIILFIFFGWTQTAFAISPTVTPTETLSPTEESKIDSLSKQINDLKNKIASRVAELNLVDKRGIVGIVSEVKPTQLTLTDPQEKMRIIDIDQITKFSSPSAKSTFGISDITPGDKVSIIGLYNKQSRRLLARFVDSVTIPVFLSGIVSDLDEDDFTVTILDENKVTTIVDIEKITKTNSYTEDDEITKSGFSKLNLGDRVVVIGYPEKTEGRLTGLRILQLPEAPKNPKIPFDYPSVTPSPAGKKATPTP